MKIDVFNHVMPATLIERIEPLVAPDMIGRWRDLKTLHDIDARLKVLDAFDDYQQIICLTMADPALEDIAGPKEAAEISRIGNDGMAAICAAHPDRFPRFIATVPMNDTAAALREIDRAILDLGACGVQIHSNVAGQPLDRDEFFPIFARMAELGRPVWLHPSRSASHADYRTESESQYEIFWALGWAYETSAAMARIVFSRMFEKLPELKIICHHWGAYIPSAEGRIFPSWQSAGNRKSHGKDDRRGGLNRPLMEYFKMFYADTVTFGAVAPGQCGLSFFGADHSLFATDAPFDSTGGAYKISSGIKLIEQLDATDADRKMIYEGNIRRLIDLP